MCVKSSMVKIDQYELRSLNSNLSLAAGPQYQLHLAFGSDAPSLINDQPSLPLGSYSPADPSAWTAAAALVPNRTVTNPSFDIMLSGEIILYAKIERDLDLLW